jgi:translocation and assembly module TamB
LSAQPNYPLYDMPEQPPLPPKHHHGWGRIVGWIALGLLALILLLVIVGAILLHNQSFKAYLLNKAQQQASEALGAPVHLQSYDLHLSHLSLDMYGVVVDSAPPFQQTPLLQVDHIALGLKITSLLHRTYYLDDIAIDHPVVHVIVDKQGRDNLPQTKKSNTQSQTNIFDLGIRHFNLSKGEVYYNDEKMPLAADLNNVSFQSAFDSTARKYSGELAYTDGNITYGTFNPLKHDLDAKFAATPTTLTLDPASVTSGATKIKMSATLVDYGNPQISAKYDASVDGAELRRIMKNPQVPEGTVQVVGTAQLKNTPNTPNTPTINNVVADGDVTSGRLRFRSPSFSGDINDVRMHYAVSGGNADLKGLHAQLLGGTIDGNAQMQDIAGNSKSHAAVDLNNISLAALKSLAGKSATAQQVALNGRLNGNVDARWGKTIDNLFATANAKIAGGVAAAKNGSNAVPVNGDIHAKYDAATKTVAFNQSYIKTPQTSLTLNGEVSNRASLQVAMQSNDLHELETVADIFRTPAPGQAQVQPLGLYGTANFNGSVRGTTAAPHLTGTLNAANLRVKDSQWRSLRADVDASPSQASLRNGQLQDMKNGHIGFNVSAGLRDWAFTDRSPIQVAVNATQLNVADLAHMAGSQAPVTGTLAADVKLTGTELNPQGNGSVTLTQAKVYGEPLQNANIKFQGTGNEIHGNAAVRLVAGSADGTFSYAPKTKAYDVQLKSSGIKLEQLQTVKDRNMHLAGTVNLNASGKGTVDNPQLVASLTLPSLQVQNQTFKGITLQANVANHLANVALDSEVLNTSIRGKGTVQLTGDYETNATLDTQLVQLQPILALYAPSQAANITGQTELHATLRGPLKNKKLVEAHVTIPTLQVKYKNAVQIGATNPLHIDYENGIVKLQRASIKGTDTDLTVEGSVPVSNMNAAPMALTLLGTVNLQLAQIFDPDVTSSGELRFNVHSTGVRADQNAQGTVDIVNASFVMAGVPVGLDNGNGTLTLTGDRLTISKFAGNVGGGQVTARGAVMYRPSVSFDLAVAAHNVRALYPDSVREAVNGDLTLTGNMEDATLGGNVNVSSISFTPDFDLNEFLGQFSGADNPPPTRGFAQNVQLDINVRSGGGVNLVSRALSLQANANLHVQGSLAEPVILGRVNLNGGDLIFMGNRYVLQGGTVDFVNPAETTPNVNVSVNTTVQQYNVQMQFRGTPDHMHTSYTSDPALPPSDIINLLAFGKTTEASAANPSPPANLAAQSMIASQVSSQITSRVSKLAGISQLSVDPVLGGNGSQQNPGARVTVQQRVTSNLFVTFSTDVTETSDEVVQLEYRKSPRVSYSATRDQNGGFGFDVKIHKKW